jgi:hypothetical protein
MFKNTYQTLWPSLFSQISFFGFDLVVFIVDLPTGTKTIKIRYLWYKTEGKHELLSRKVI